VDRDRRPGRFLLTGSADLLLLPAVSESLAGRMEIVRLHPMTAAEKARRPAAFSNGCSRAAEAAHPSCRTGAVRPRAAPARGGLSRSGAPPAARLRQWHRAYVEALVERDARDVATLRNLDHLRGLLTLLAHQTAQLLNVNAAATHLGIRRETVENHLAALERLFLVRRVPAWHPNQARRLVKAPKAHVVDSGVAAALAGLNEHDWLPERERFGHILESFVLEQLIAQADAMGAGLAFCHYRDKDQVEVDVVMTRGGRSGVSK
jgi:predicted AAA+ superfamily ATPase